MQVAAFLDGLSALADESHRQKLAYYGIPNEWALGVRMPDIRAYVKPFRGEAQLALDLFESDYHEAKLAAGLIYPGKQLSLDQADAFMQGLYSWDLVDQFCSGLFVQAPFAKDLPYLWTPLPAEYNRRSGIVMIACLSMKHKKRPDAELLPYLELVREYIDDERNFVKKAHSWTLRTLGKRSLWLNEQVVNFIEKHWQNEKGEIANWAARDAWKELRDPRILDRLRLKAQRAK
jgi:3-methyladenine DNA glycosylase AlkD